MIVYALDQDPAVRLAVEELARCLSRMAGTTVETRPADRFDGQSAIYVGQADQFDGDPPLAPVKEPRWDDAWGIKSTGRSLVIAGVNPRSTLMAAYQYLRLLGAEWLTPGEQGEHLPPIDSIPLAGFEVSEVAANRHRGVCIEGAPALEHVLNMVEWLPRVGLNAYFLQFQVSSFFWRAWYRHDLNPLWPERRDLTEAECRALEEKVVAAVKERGLLLHRVGHGWTAAALGLPANGWVQHEGELPDEDTCLVAQVNGQRELWSRIPINTELCYGNAVARRKLVDTILGYAAENPKIDILHFWLSDAVNNHCECGDCRERSPSDWYVILLNELSPKLKQVAPDMKLAFLAYLDTLWPPSTVDLDISHDNLVYVFAPISRCYGHHLCHPECGEDRELPRPRLNEVVMPQDNHDNRKLLRMWSSVRPADSFAYEYHFMTMWIHDHLSVKLLELVPRDVEDYARNGIDGIVNCCTQRAFYPNGWSYHVMARTLFGQAPGEADRARYFRQAYGEHGQVALEFLDELARLSPAPIHRLSWWDVADMGTTAKVLGFLSQKESSLDAGLAGARTAEEQHAWRLLLHYRRLLAFLWAALRERLSGRPAAAEAHLLRAKRFLQETEAETASALDTFLMLQYLDRLMQSCAERSGQAE